ncbi:glycosyltransferase [Kineococcus siccus]|uniref:glycosyltransferase n=1 Tax=Kineococcus siccus TaxID=2696567 RepID=UPI00196B2C72
MSGDVPGRHPAPGTARVVVAVLTYRRPADLAELLPLVLAQAARLPAARVLVVDNDPDAGAGELVAAAAATATAPLDYAHEPRPGIAAARNRALAEAAADDLLVFLDDDERPGPRWLADLLAVHEETGAAGVVGPVVSSFAEPLDPWIVAGRFFDRRRLPTGTRVHVAATNNLLLDLRAVRATGVVFDERFGLSGGSDTLFTRELTAAGLSLVWCDEAVVTDVVPAARATRDWVLRRALRSGNGWSRTSLALAPDPLRRWRTRGGLTVRGAARVATGAVSVGAGVLTRRPALVARGARTLARGAGFVSGAWGWTYVEYRRPREAS